MPKSRIREENERLLLLLFWLAGPQEFQAADSLTDRASERIDIGFETGDPLCRGAPGAIAKTAVWQSRNEARDLNLSGFSRRPQCRGSGGPIFFN